MDILNIEKFHHGLILSADMKDIPEDAASESNAIDGDTSEGELRGTPANSSIVGYGTNAAVSTFITEDNDAHTLVYYDPTNNAVKAVRDFYGTPSESTLITGIDANAKVSMTSHNKSACIGLGDTGTSATGAIWVGYVGLGQFGGSAPGLVCDSYKLDRNYGTSAGNFAISITEIPGSPPRYFPINTRIKYALSLEYDGYQESPLYRIGSYVMAADCQYITVTVTAYGTPASKRISAVNVYRADSPNNREDSLGYSRLVKRIDINDVAWVTSGGNHTFTFNDTGEVGVSYEGSTGMPETLTENRIWYGVSCTINNSLIIADCNHAILKDASHILFKSKPGCFNMIDWTNDFVRLPFIPKALAAFNGRIYAFDDNRYAKINPDGLNIEEIYEGAGCTSQRSVVVTEKGMFFCNRQNIWAHDGREPQPIGNYIRQSTSGVIAWQDQTSWGIPPIAVSNTKRDSVLFLVTGGEYTSRALDIWSYHISRQRWDYQRLSADVIGAFSGKDGEAYYSNATSLIKLYGETSRSAWTFISKDFTLDLPSQNKMFYRIRTIATGTPTVYYSLDGGAWVEAPADGAITLANAYKKRIRIKITDTGTGAVYSASIIYRKLIGAR